MTEELHHPHLELWRENVGEPITLDIAPRLYDEIVGLDVLSWNLAIGEGRLHELVERLREGAFGGAGTNPHRPLVVLAQEAFRSGEAVPAALRRRYHGGKARASGTRHDIAELARQLGLSLTYAPSMRNGLDRSDRGNAILATAALAPARHLTLPFVRQRRVAVAATLAGIPMLTLASAHLDTRGAPAPRPIMAAFGAGRIAQTLELVRRLAAEEHVLIGADLNSYLGVRDPVIRALRAAGFKHADPIAPWTHTFRGPLRMLLDHVLFRSADALIASVRAQRLDDPKATRWRVYGSDHYPLLARVTFTTPLRPQR